MAVVDSHIADVMIAVRERIKAHLATFGEAGVGPGVDVEINNPAGTNIPTGTNAKNLVTLFLYRIEPDHAAYLSTPERGLVVRLKVMINVYGVQTSVSGESARTTELRVLSEILRLFMEHPQFGPIRVKGTTPTGVMQSMASQGPMIEAQPLSLDMEEINHIWTTQGDAAFRTALVYSFNYGVVAPKAPKDEGPPVLRTEAVVTPDFTGPPVTPVVRFGALAFRSGAVLTPTLSRALGAGVLRPGLVLVTEEGGTFDIVVEKFRASDGTWQLVLAPATESRKIDAHVRADLAPASVPAATPVTIANPSSGDIYRLSVRPEAPGVNYQIGYVTLTIT